MNAARVRIGRVKMKNGGADVRVLARPEHPDNPVRHRVRLWVADVLRGRPPDAVALVAWWTDGDGRAAYSVSAGTYTDAVPIMLLPEFTRAAVADHLQFAWAEDRVMRTLGYRRDDDPDPAA